VQVKGQDLEQGDRLPLPIFLSELRLRGAEPPCDVRVFRRTYESARSGSTR
jgi:hypothetical protein